MNQSLTSRSKLCREILLIMVMVAYNLRVSQAAIEVFSIPPNTGCACPGEVLMYTCTAVGAGNSIWEGSAFDCAGNSIILRHSQFGTGNSGDCNGGDISARSIGVTNDCYTSMLSARVSPGFNGKSINCSHHSLGISTIGSSTVTVLEAPYPPPGNVRLASVREGLLSFSWKSLGPNCDSASYCVLSDCGGCPNSTNLTTVNCTDLQLSTEARECAFTVQVELCGGAGSQSSPITVMLKLPDAPRARFIPRFSEDTKRLTEVLVTLDQTVSYEIADNISGSVTSYVMKISSNSRILLSSSLTPTPCVDISCEEFVSVPFQCSSSTVSVTLSAANRLGVGPASEPLNIDCTNDFVEVKYDSATSTITCTFADQQGVVSCQLQYRDCSSQLTRVSRGNTTSNTVVLNLQLSGSGQEYCYIVTASNDSYTVMVEGRFSTVTGFPVAATVVIVLLLGAALIIVLVPILIVVVSRFYKRRNYRMQRLPEDYLGHAPLNQFATVTQDVKNAEKLMVESRFNLKRIDLNDVVFFKLKSSYPTELITFVESAFKPQKFERGCAYYEFIWKEDISHAKEIIFMNEDGEYFYPDIDKGTLLKEGMIGEDLEPPRFKDYRVFIQSTGSGKRCIPKDGLVLYKKFMRMHKHPPILVDASKFALRKVPHDCTLKSFCGKCAPKANINAVYVELDCIEDVGDIRDVILLDKGTDRLFTGTAALHMAKEHYEHSKPIDKRHWRVYVYKEFGETFQLKKDMYVLYQMQLVQKQEESEKSHQNAKSPLVSIDSTSFVAENIAKTCTLDKFREEHHLDADVYNVFVESSSSSLENKDVLDIIFEDKERGNILYTCCAQWNEIKGYFEDEHRWRVYALMDYGAAFVLSANTRVIYRARSKQMNDATLIPIMSRHFRKVTLENSCTVDQFKDAVKPLRSNVFLELKYIQKETNIVDVILMEKVNGKLYSGPYAHEMVKKHLGGAQYLDQDIWEAYVYSKFKGDLELDRNSSILYQDPDVVAQEFGVLTVDEDNVRLSEYIEQKLGVYEKSDVFYEFSQNEDLLSYKEILHVPEGELNARKCNESQVDVSSDQGTPSLVDSEAIGVQAPQIAKTAKDDPSDQETSVDIEPIGVQAQQETTFNEDVPCDQGSQSLVESEAIFTDVPAVQENKVLDCTKIKLESTTKLFYGISGAPGWEVKHPNIRGMRVFIQCTSQGSRCLKKGMLILYKMKS